MLRKRRGKVELLEGQDRAALKGNVICSVLRHNHRSRLELIYGVGRTIPAVFNRKHVMIASGYHPRSEYELMEYEERE
jgi:hypothetical protein